MTRREDGPGQNPLFDLPLHPDETATAEAEPPPEPEEPPAPQEEAPVAAAPRSPAGGRSRPAPGSSTHASPSTGSRSTGSRSTGSRSTLAPLLPRILAAGADILVHLGALAVAALGLSALGHPLRVEDGPPLALLLVSFSFLYTVVSLAFWGQTAGMAWFGLASRQSPQFPLSFGQAAIRWLGGLLTLALAGLPLLLTLRGDSLSDRLSRSRTYRAFSGSP